MPALTAEEIWSALAENSQAPNGPVKIARAEYLADAAEAAGEPPLYVQALIDVIVAYEYGAEQSKLLVPFARLLRLWDADPGAFDGRRRHSLFWYFKWASGGMLSVPEVPLASIAGWLGEMESRYRQAGHSPRAVHMGRHRLAREVGDGPAAEREFEAWLDAPRDAMADCVACEAGDQGWWHAFNGRDEQALELWAPVLGGKLVCAEEPHRVLAHSLLPLVRLGRLDEARANHLRGYRMARGVANLRSTIARHVEFCALTGNEARGLEILTEHAAFLAPGAEDAESRLDFLTGALILLRRLIALGLGGLEFSALEFSGLELGRLDVAGAVGAAGPAAGESTVADAATSAETQIAAICARFDARNGNATVSERTAQRLAQKPLVASLPLGSSTVLPRPAPAAQDRQPAQGPATTTQSASSATRSRGLDDLVAEAERLTTLRHPHAYRAWERVAAGGFELPDRIAARVDRSRARELADRDPAAALPVFRSLAERFEQLGEPAEARTARGSAVLAMFMSGDEDTARAEAEAIAAEAGEAYAAGELTARQYINLRNLSAYLAFNAFARQADSSDPAEAAAADPEPAARLVTAELDLALQLGGDPGRAAIYHRMLAQLAFFRQQAEEVSAHLEASRDLFLTADQVWDAAEPEGLLAQLALHSGDAVTAERHVCSALAHAGDAIDPRARARFGSLLVEVLTRQPGREFDLVDAALRAAELCEGVSEPDLLQNRFTAARAYLNLKRYGEAAALFDELMPRVHVPYADRDIALTREQYGDCLTQLQEHRKAAEQYLAAAALVQDDPQNQLAHARIAWSAAQALQSGGLVMDALAAFRRAAELWGGLGNVPARVRCLRSAAWLLSWPDSETGASSWSEAVAAMRAVLAELEALPEDERSEPVEAEVGNTVEQLDAMIEQQQNAEAEQRRTASEDGDE